jgi:hypothetical protein
MNFIDIPDLEKHQTSLINFRNTRGNTNTLWWCHFKDEVDEHLPDLTKMFKEHFSLTVRQLIYFCIPHNKEGITDPNHPESIFIHIDGKDEDWTLFDPNFAVNIPLEHCEGTYTMFYEKINDDPDPYYPVYDCGGVAHTSVKEAFRFQLHKTAVLRINEPHGVFNPNKELRVVATIRFEENLEHLLEKE